jgi:intracellular sulfur oxidation DsrE/DsrF family protein
MSQDKHISDEQLNAFIDRQLTTDERVQVLDALKKDDELSKKLCELQRNDEFSVMAYNTIPEPSKSPYDSAIQKSQRRHFALVAGMLVIISLATGWQLHQLINTKTLPQIGEISQLDPSTLRSDKIILHISVLDGERINKALDKAEALLKDKRNRHLQLEIVANADGVRMLGTGSPYANRIASLSGTYKNVSFKACGIAMQAVKLKQGKDMTLLPEVEKVPAALDQILKRLKGGWVYIHA